VSGGTPPFTPDYSVALLLWLVPLMLKASYIFLLLLFSINDGVKPEKPPPRFKNFIYFLASF
jgi:hypothetical protein